MWNIKEAIKTCISSEFNHILRVILEILQYFMLKWQFFKSVYQVFILTYTIVHTVLQYYIIAFSTYCIIY